MRLWYEDTVSALNMLLYAVRSLQFLGVCRIVFMDDPPTPPQE